MNKFNKFKKNLSDLYTDDIPINLSPSLSYRSRCEFGYSKNCYTMKENFKTVYLKTFPDACMSIQQIMPKLLNKINSSEIVKFKLFQINFRANSKNKILITLIYHTKISELLIHVVGDNFPLNIYLLVLLLILCLLFYFQIHLEMNYAEKNQQSDLQSLCVIQR